MKSIYQFKCIRVDLIHGFGATIAVVLISIGLLVFSLATFSGAASYADLIYRKELRMQANLNTKTCLEIAQIMVAKDHFINGEVEIPDFGCVANFTNNFSTVNISVKASISGVSAYGTAKLVIQN